MLYQGFDTSGARETLGLLAGFGVTFLGVHLLNVSRAREQLQDEYEAVEGEEVPLASLEEQAEDEDETEWTEVHAGVSPPRLDV